MHGLGRDRAVRRAGLVGVLGDPEAERHAGQRVHLGLGDLSRGGQPVDGLAQAGDERVVQVLAEPDDDPGAVGLAQRAAQRHRLVQVVADFEVLRRGFDRGLVDHPIALQGVHVPVPHPRARLGDRQEQVAARGQVAQHQVPAVAARQDRADRVVTCGLDADDAQERGHRQPDAMGEFRGRPRVVEREVVQVRLGKVMRQRADAEREGVPAPADRAQRGDAALDHVARLGAGHFHRPEHGVRAVGVAVAQRLAVCERHAVDSLVPPVRPGVGIADRIPGRDRGNGLSRRVQKAGSDRLRCRLDRVRRGHCVSFWLSLGPTGSWVTARCGGACLGSEFVGDDER